MMKRLDVRWALVCGLLAAGCSSSDDTGGGGDLPEPVSVMVSAAEGGTVEIGEAALTIPAGALSADTTITVEASEPSGLPEADSLQGFAYDFGPDGTTFNQPVSLALPLVGSPAEGQEAVVAWFDEEANAWQDVPSVVANGKVSGEIEHFTTFIVRFRDAGPVDCSFSPCGGDVVGTWDIAGVCVMTNENPFQEACPTATIEIVVDGSGAVTFNSDLTYTVGITLQGNFQVDFPAECDSICQQVGAGDEDFSCTGATDGTPGCSCGADIDEAEPTSGTYAILGNSITFTEEGSTEGGDAAEYCVDGDTLKVSQTEDEGATSFVWTGTR